MLRRLLVEKDRTTNEKSCDYVASEMMVIRTSNFLCDYVMEVFQTPIIRTSMINFHLPNEEAELL